ncbi:hypothetical protein L484_001548 [Morus notabilis]|uniref:Uncharacterized protein n=1 Tax=Morus notabilis TaxID=981085 RepID=W9SC36_9ROSA|nr:hypothetical protein L484_001548 [Morus notabilis]
MSLSESPVILVDRKAADGFEKHDPAYNGQLDQAIGGGDVVFEELSEMIDAAVKVQKAFRGHRERCMLADSAIASEELWSKALDFAAMNQSTISFFKSSTPETAVSRWNRVSSNASKIDPRHRYGKNLHVYYDEWSKADSGQPFFYWLDIGDGKELDLQKCPRSKLREQCVKYLGPKEREQYEYIVREGKLIHKQTGDVLDTQADMSIFVMSTSKQLYVGQKKRGRFHHSSFLAGGVTIVAGTLGAENGTLKSISPFTGHYQTTSERLETFLSFFKENGVNLSEVQVYRSQALNFAPLNRNTILLFNSAKPETAASRWNRVSSNASRWNRVGKGLCLDDRAQKLVFQQWIEAVKLDIGDGKKLDLEKCPRSELREQCVKYLRPKISSLKYFDLDRNTDHYTVPTNFQKNKGKFHHSIAAGRMEFSKYVS